MFSIGICLMDLIQVVVLQVPFRPCSCVVSMYEFQTSAVIGLKPYQPSGHNQALFLPATKKDN